MTRSRGQRFGDIELTDYLVNVVGPVPLVMDLRITHECWGSSSDPSINGHLHYPNDIDRSLNETVSDKFRKYRADYNNNPPNFISFMSVGVHLAQHDRDQFHFHHTFFSSQLKSKIGNIVVKTAALRIMLNIDGTPVVSRSHTYPSHSQTSRLLTLSLSLGVPDPRSTQCMRDV